MAAKEINLDNVEVVYTILDKQGQYRAIIKKGGLIEAIDDFGIERNLPSGPKWKRGIDVLESFKHGLVQSIEFKASDSISFVTVFARCGKRMIFIDQQILDDIKNMKRPFYF